MPVGIQGPGESGDPGIEALTDKILPRMRTELNAIIGRSRMLIPENADQAESMEAIEEGAENLVAFLDDYLNLRELAGGGILSLASRMFARSDSG